jgi:hypothetical protein
MWMEFYRLPGRYFSFYANPFFKKKSHIFQRPIIIFCPRILRASHTVIADSMKWEVEWHDLHPNLHKLDHFVWQYLSERFTDTQTVMVKKTHTHTHTHTHTQRDCLHPLPQSPKSPWTQNSRSMCFWIGYDVNFVHCLRVYIQKFPDWPPGARTANGTALCH